MTRVNLTLRPCVLVSQRPLRGCRMIRRLFVSVSKLARRASEGLKLPGISDPSLARRASLPVMKSLFIVLCGMKKLSDDIAFPRQPGSLAFRRSHVAKSSPCMAWTTRPVLLSFPRFFPVRFSGRLDTLEKLPQCTSHQKRPSSPHFHSRPHGSLSGVAFARF